MGLKDFLQMYCEIVSTNELLEKLPPEKVNIIFSILPIERVYYILVGP